jgi:hypothetical protein
MKRMEQFSGLGTLNQTISLRKGVSWVSIGLVFLFFINIVFVLLFFGSLEVINASTSNSDEVTLLITIKQSAEMDVSEDSETIITAIDVAITGDDGVYPISELTILRYGANMVPWRIEVSCDSEYFYDQTSFPTPKPSTDLEVYADEVYGWVAVSTIPQVVVDHTTKPSFGELPIQYRLMYRTTDGIGI